MVTDYSTRISIPVFPTEDQKRLTFTTTKGTPIAKGYQRVVIGARGPYVEFDPSDLIYDDDAEIGNFVIPEYARWRISNPSAYYVEYRTTDGTNLKIYDQKRIVDYADYRVGFMYIDPFQLMVDGQLIIEPIKRRKS